MILGKILARLLHLVPVLLGVSVICFVMVTMTPGDPVEIMLGDQLADEAQREALRRDMGLDRPLVERYFVYVGNALEGDFGRSFQHRRPVGDVILERLPATVELTLAAMVIALATAIPLGVLAAVRKNTATDRITTTLSLVGVSMPNFWFAILLVILFAVELRWVPFPGRIGSAYAVEPITHLLLIDTLLRGRPDAFLDALAHLILPAVTLGLAMAALLTRVTRASMIEVLTEDYIRFARIKGLPRRRILMRHALKNALIPTVTVAAIETGSLLGGNMVVEYVYGWPGLGSLVVEGIFNRNYPIVLTIVLLYTITYVLMNGVADVLYICLNPRVRK